MRFKLLLVLQVLIIALVFTACGVKSKKYNPETLKDDLMQMSLEERVKVTIAIGASIDSREKLQEYTYEEIMKFYDEAIAKANEPNSSRNESAGNSEVEERGRFDYVFDYLEIDSIKTGMLEEYEDRIYPIVIMKWRNKSDQEFKTNDLLMLKVTFIYENEEYGNNWTYLQTGSDNPLLPGISKQVSIKSTRGFTTGKGYEGIKITAHIYLGEERIKTVEISGNDILYRDIF